MRLTRQLAAAAVIIAVAATASARAPKPPVCRDGRFVTPPGTPPLIAGAIVAAPEALVIGGATPTIAIAGHCPAVRVRIRGTRKGTRVVASWPKNACGPGKVQLTAMIDAGCHAMQGVLRVSRSRPVHFIAPRCGDGMIDTVDGEACDGAAGCDAGQECSPDCRCVARSGPPPAVSFGGDVQPIFSARCAVPLCHSGATPTQGLDLSPGRSYAAIVSRPSTERPDLKIVDPGAPATSYLEWKISGAPAGQSILGSPMPLTGGPLPAAEQAIIRAWIAEGAVNDQPASTTSTTVPSTSTTVVTVTSTSITSTTSTEPPTPTTSTTVTSTSTTVATVTPTSTTEATVTSTSTTSTTTTELPPPTTSTTVTSTSTTVATVTSTSTTTTQPPALVSFRGDIQPIFTARCALPGCHSGPIPTQGLDLSDGSSYAALVGRSSTELPTVKLIDPGSATTSYLLWKVGKAPAGQSIMGLPMPLLGGPLTLAQVVTISDWVTQGALDN